MEETNKISPNIVVVILPEYRHNGCDTLGVCGITASIRGTQIKSSIWVDDDVPPALASTALREAMDN